MDNNLKLYRPEILEHIYSYLSCENTIEKRILKPTLTAVIVNILEENVAKDLVLHQIISSLEYIRMHHSINLSNQIKDIIEIYKIAKNYNATEDEIQKNNIEIDKTVKQIVVMIHKLQ